MVSNSRMLFGNISLQLFLYILCVATGSVVSCLFFIGGYKFPGCLCIIGVIICVIRILVLFNSVNRKIVRMFEAFSNDDYTLKLTETEGSDSERMLSFVLNRIKQIIQKMRIDAQQKERFYELMLDKIHSGIIVLNPKGFVLQCNDAALKLLGLSVFTHVSQLSGVDPSLPQLFDALQPGDSRTFSLATERGNIQLNIKTSGMLLDKENIRLVVVHDIENEMDEKEIESWIKLIRVLSHEIMNSIAPITSLSDTLLSMQKDPEADVSTLRKSTVNGLQVISETGKGLVSFVESYRKFTRIPTPEREWFSVRDFVQRIVILSSVESNFSNVKITTNEIPEDMKLYADGNLLGQVMINLVKNAIQALVGRTDGSVQIEVETVEEKRTRFSVIDNGPGIPPELVKQIFVPFFTTKEQGSGIGLSIARQIMRAHGGSIRVHSVVGEGTKFIIEL